MFVLFCRLKGTARLRLVREPLFRQTLRSLLEPLALRVTNAGADPIEFESFALNREKVIEPGQTITVHLPSLNPGAYDFYDDFHQEVPEGSIVAQ